MDGQMDGWIDGRMDGCKQPLRLGKSDEEISAYVLQMDGQQKKELVFSIG